MDWDLQYGELSKDLTFVNTCENLKEDLLGMQKVLDELLPFKAPDVYDKLSLEDRIELDLCLVYMLNSLEWVNLRVQGIDPTKHPIQGRIKLIQTTMLEWEQVKAEQNRPTINLPAAQRFIKRGLSNPNNMFGIPPTKKNNTSTAAEILSPALAVKRASLQRRMLPSEEMLIYN